MKKARQLLALALSLAMALTMLSACGQTGSSSSAPASVPASASASGSGSDSSTEESTGERPTITIGLQQSPKVIDYETNSLTKWLEEQNNCNIDFVYFSTDLTESATQLSLMLSSGEKLPDILWLLESVGTAQMFEYGEDGYFIDCKPYLEKEGTNFRARYNLMDADDQQMMMALGTDPSTGAIYGLPFFNNTPDPITQVNINKDWLEKFGMEIPTTVDELYEFLVKCRDEDPNGNGVADEIPLLSFDSYRSNIVEFLSNAWVYLNDQYVFNVTDGKLWCPYTTDEYREGLIYMRKMVDEGLISDLFFTLPSDAEGEMTALFTPEDGVAKCGVVCGYATIITDYESPVITQYVNLPPLSGETELGGYAAMWADNISYYTFITSSCENPDLAFSVMDSLYSEEGMLRMSSGTPDVNWKYVNEGTDRYGHPATYRNIDSAYSKTNNELWCRNEATEIILIDEPPFVWSRDYSEMDPIAAARVHTLYDLRENYLAGRHPDEVFDNVVYTAEEQEVVAECRKPVRMFAQEQRNLFLTGAIDPSNDSDWQTYLDGIENQGLSRWMEVAQSAYTRMKSTS